MLDVDDFAMNTDTSSTLIAYEMSRSGLGPKMFGLFKGGSVEEFIDSHTLTYEESTDPDISRDIALSLAAVHAIEGLPLRRDAVEHNFRLEKEWSKLIPNQRDFLLNDEKVKHYKGDMEFLLNFDYEKVIEWVISKCNELKMRKNFVLLDMNYLNCLVRNQPMEDEKRVVLIDYDLAQYNYRGIDLGGHFFNRRFDVTAKGDKMVVTGSSFFSDEHKRRFLTIYQQEIKRLKIWNDFDEDGVDSIDNLLIESAMGKIFVTLYFATNMVAKADVFYEFLPCLEFMLRHVLILMEEIEQSTSRMKVNSNLHSS